MMYTVMLSYDRPAQAKNAARFLEEQKRNALASGFEASEYSRMDIHRAPMSRKVLIQIVGDKDARLPYLTLPMPR